MQRLEVSGAVRPIYGSLGVKRLTASCTKGVVGSSVITWRERICQQQQQQQHLCHSQKVWVWVCCITSVHHFRHACKIAKSDC